MLFLVLWAIVQVCQAGQLIIDNEWPGGFQGHFDMTPNKDIHGWKITLVFDQPLESLELFNSEAEYHNATTYVIHNLDWDKDVVSGDILTVGFVATLTTSSKIGGSGQYFIENSSAFTTRTTRRTTTRRTTTRSTTSTTTSTTPRSTTATTEPPTTRDYTGTTPPVYQGTGGSDMKYNYPAALKLSILFYDAQRSGKLPDDNPIPWRGDSALDDGADVGLDLTGGWYDAGDNVKFGFPMAWSSYVLNWGFLEFEDAYKVLELEEEMCDMVRWPLEYFLKAWIPEKYTLYVQVGNGTIDHKFWGRPENMNMSRPSYKVNTACPGSDVAAKTASALASGYLVFRDICGEPEFADRLLDAAESVFAFARMDRGLYTDCLNGTGAFYRSNKDNDEMATAAAWLYKATGNTRYLQNARYFYMNGTAWGFNWNDDDVAAAILLYDITGEDKYLADIMSFLANYDGGSVPQTPCGLTFRDKWGANRHAANAAFIALLAAKRGIDPDRYKNYALSQINYILGDNSQNISYVIGLGDDYPRFPHHRGSSCAVNETTCSIDDPDENPNLLVGALVGGPGENDEYTDERGDYVHNEVATDYNAGFQGAIAGLIHFAANSLLPLAPEAKC